MYYQFDSRLNMPAILFDDDRIAVGRDEYDYNDIESIEISKAPFLSTYGILEMKLKSGRKVPVPFAKADLHRIRTAVQEAAHIIETRRQYEEQRAGSSKAAPGTGTREVSESAVPASDRLKTAAAVPMDPYEEMKKLKELLDLGIVTQEEFDRKKKELLKL